MRELRVGAALKGRQEEQLYSLYFFIVIAQLSSALSYLAVDRTHGPDDWLRAVGKDGLVVSRIIIISQESVLGLDPPHRVENSAAKK